METITRTEGCSDSHFKPVEIWAEILWQEFYPMMTQAPSMSYLSTGNSEKLQLQWFDRSEDQSVGRQNMHKTPRTCHDLGTHSIRTSFTSMLSTQQIAKQIMLQGQYCHWFIHQSLLCHQQCQTPTMVNVVGSDSGAKQIMFQGQYCHWFIHRSLLCHQQCQTPTRWRSRSWQR